MAFTALQQFNRGVLQQLIPELPQHAEVKQTGQISQWQPVVGALGEQKNLTSHFCKKIPVKVDVNQSEISAGKER